jgi:hypothetical protein
VENVVFIYFDKNTERQLKQKDREKKRKRKRERKALPTGELGI